ncbi:MAG: CHAP domain-containing protein [Saprospiraceae bacterium]|nr:CHAP domain-containing protein [Bacteroidia bacterium]MBT8228649.1 CHAP domain-containing protein [Bacteroidia bacterium]NNF21890.1 CHAP domain-containing protein [Saprospiraceae bacterium]NNK90416.1 CHAP domain-containing protein [Saprospiraceae bacterium]
MKLYFYILLLFFISKPAGDSAFVLDSKPEPGKIIDIYDGVPVYYNGDMNNVFGRNTTMDGYNLGLKYQCIEYVKRYYYYRKDHKMNDPYGHAKDFYDKSLDDRKYNKKRGLYQFANGSEYRPIAGDILVFDADWENPFGHIGIVTKSEGHHLEIIQQNVGEQTRAHYRIYKADDLYYINDGHILGWLRKG